MSTQVDLTEETKQEIQKIRQHHAELLLSLGSLELEEEKLNKRLSNIKVERLEYIEQNIKLEQEESNLFNKLKEEYGEGRLDFKNFKWIKST